MLKSKVAPTIYEAVVSNPKAIIIRCPDRRFRKAHRGFIENELGLRPEDFWPLKPAGGAAALARPFQMPSEFDALIIQIEIFIKHSQIEHIVLINHQDCKRYDELPGSRRERDQEKNDLLPAGRLLARKYPGTEVSAYYARFTDERHTHIFFEAVRSSSLQKIQLRFNAVMP